MTVEPKPWDKLQAILPPLATYELDMLIESISQHGVLQPILVLPDGRIIDGRHRWAITNGRAPFKVLDLSEDEAFELGVAINTAHRNMSHMQMREVLRKQKWAKEYLHRIPKCRVSIPRKEYEKIYERCKQTEIRGSG